MKLTEAIELFYRVNRPTVAPGTVTTYQDALEQRFVPFLQENYGDLALEELTRDHIRAFRDWLLTVKRKTRGRKHASLMESPEAQRRRKKGLLSLWTVHRHMKVIRRLFNFLVEEGVLDPSQSPMLGVKMVSVGSTAAGAIPTEAVIRMLAVARRPPLLAMYKARDQAIKALIYTPGPAEGLECGSGELSRLTLDDVDGRILHLRALSWQARPDVTEFEIEMSEAQHRALNRWLKMRPPDFETTSVFTTLDNRGGLGGGEPMRQRAVYSAYFKEKNLTTEARATREKHIRYEAKYAARRLALILFFLDTGARLGGVLGLTRDRLELGSRRAVVIEKGKGGSKVRSVFFSQETAAAIATWLELNDQVFDTVFGMKPFRVRNMFSKLAQQAGADDTMHNPHAFRHTFAKLAIVNGADLSQVQRFMGHSSITVTADFYIHWDADELARIHDQVSPIGNLAS